MGDAGGQVLVVIWVHRRCNALDLRLRKQAQQAARLMKYGEMLSKWREYMVDKNCLGSVLDVCLSQAVEINLLDQRTTSC